MRYVIFSALYPPHLGGVERYTRNLARHLAGRGDEVTVVTSALVPTDVGREVDEAGAAVVRLPAIPAMDGRLPLIAPLGPWRRMLDGVADAGADRVVVNTRFYPLSLAGVEFGGRRGLPTLVIDHGQGFLTVENPVADRAVEAYERAVTAWQRRWRPRYAGVSRRSAAWLAELGIETDRVVPNAIDADGFRAESTGRDFRGELGLDLTDPLVVFCGRLYESKGAGIVVDAARFLPRATVAMVGEGPVADAMGEGGPGNLHLLGALSHGDLSALLSQADALLLPSLREGFATTLLEAGAWGVPPVTTPVGGSDEVLADPDWGVVLERRTPLALAMGADEVLRRPPEVRAERSAALADHVRTSCTWEGTLEALDRAFA